MAEIVITDRNDFEHFSKIRTIARDENGECLSCAWSTYTRSSFGNEMLNTVCTGGVSTPVENRRGGNVRRIFDYIHTFAAEEEDCAVSLLHPFSFAYYRKFGYEKVSDTTIVEFPTRYIDFVARRCKFVQYDDSKLNDMLYIYREFAKSRNLLLQRFDNTFYNTKSNSPNETKHCYICYDDNGNPMAYIVYTIYKELYVNHYINTWLTVNEMAYTSAEALREIFSFLRMYEGECDMIRLTDLSIYSEVELLLKNYTHTSYKSVPDLMARVLNTEKMLNAQAYPIREGEFTVKIVDVMPSVAGTFKVSFGAGEHTVKRVDTAAPDLTLEVGTFARLIYGYDGLTQERAKYLDGIDIHNNCEDFFRAFPKKPCGAFEHF